MNIKEKDKPVIYVDIDDTICTQDGHNYEEAKPDPGHLSHHLGRRLRRQRERPQPRDAPE